MTVFESRGGGDMSAFELVLTSVVHLSYNNVVFFTTLENSSSVKGRPVAFSVLFWQPVRPE